MFTIARIARRTAVVPLTLAAVLVAAGLPAAASAASVSVEDPDAAAAVSVLAAPGERNQITVRAPDLDTVEIVDAGAPLTTAAGAGCTAADAHTVTCPRSSHRFAARVDAGDADDTVTAAGAAPIRAFAGSGRNVLTGGAGADELTSTTGDDALVGGEGDDRLTVGAHTATVTCGSGRDAIVEQQQRHAPRLAGDCESLEGMRSGVDGPYVDRVVKVRVALNRMRRHGAFVTAPVTCRAYAIWGPCVLAAILQPPAASATLARLDRRVVLSTRKGTELRSGVLRLRVAVGRRGAVAAGKRVRLVVVDHDTKGEWLDGPVRLSVNVPLR